MPNGPSEKSPSDKRVAEAEVDPLFINRWSPGNFSTKPIANKDIMSLFEAARWSPSSFNEQPWLFIYGQPESALQRLSQILKDNNRKWADKAPLLVFVFAKKHFDLDGRENSCANFDTGAACLALSLQASKLNLHTHAMAGIHLDKAYDVLEVPQDKYEAICAIAIGNCEESTEESEGLEDRPLTGRNPIRKFALEGTFNK